MQVDQAAIRQLLNRKFLESRVANPNYSLRAYARRLRLSSGALSAILGAKRRVSRKFAERLAEKLGLSPAEKSKMLEGKTDSNRESNLEEDQFRSIVEWY